ncbi:unnamed protein product [Anisakis simplex]|uniref:UDENN domain-containing protein n=1 Tax=Anisakis simplex TaxID=6269 RepID=A0A0M3K4I3_ANISI|nr:unnamed protein product [Anisakis simplex]
MLLLNEPTVYTTRCYSCASTAYLSLWNQLMHHYFPPKNFTERCWHPDSDVGTVHCSTACFTLVEHVYEHFSVSSHAVMRGCVDRFLLFGLDEDVRDALVDRNECRATDRQLLHLVSLTPDTDLVGYFSLSKPNTAHNHEHFITEHTLYITKYR